MYETRLAHFLRLQVSVFLAVNSTPACLQLVPPNFPGAQLPVSAYYNFLPNKIPAENLKFSRAVIFDSKNSHYFICDELQGLETVTFVSIVYFGYLFRQWQFCFSKQEWRFSSAFTVHFTSKALCNSSFSNSSLFFAFSISTTDLPPSPSWSARSATSAAEQK